MTPIIETQYPQPSFLKGFFSWVHFGYSPLTESPVDLLEPALLGSRNPWLVVSAVLEHARHGNHNYIPLLSNYCASATGIQGFEVAAIELVGNAGLESDLVILRAAMENGSDQVKSYAAGAASMTGRLWLIPSMLAAWKSVAGRNHRGMIGSAISSLLDSPRGLISESADSDSRAATENLSNLAMRALAELRVADQSGADFELLVRERFSLLECQYGEHAVLWQGEPFSVSRLVSQMYNLVRDTEAGPLQGLFIEMRQKFEATTGFSCATCFRNGALQPLSAAVVLERFLETGAPERYVDGVRYFCGHRIPD